MNAIPEPWLIKLKKVATAGKLPWHKSTSSKEKKFSLFVSFKIKKSLLSKTY
jgi:hypothetical protein